MHASFAMPITRLNVNFKISTSQTKLEVEARTVVGNFIEEVQSSLKTIIAFGGEAKETERFENQHGKMMKYYTKRLTRGSIALGLTKFVAFVQPTWVMLYGLHLIERESCSPDPQYNLFVLSL